ncbi:MAG: NAD(P)H-binding protein [Succinivibrio sp.]|nr:NAD(P)H-binding protein [Succinivibrio sp.]
MKTRTVMVLGAVGHVGPYIVDETLKLGHKVRALIWNAEKSANLPSEIGRVEGRLDDVSRLSLPLEGVDGLIVQVGMARNIGNNPEIIDYRSLSNLLKALEGRKVHVVIMTAANSFLNTNEIAPEAYFQMRISELMVRCSGLPYTIVRCGKALNGLTVNALIKATPLSKIIDDPHALMLAKKAAQVAAAERKETGAPQPEENEDDMDLEEHRRASLTARQVGRVLANSIFCEKAYGKAFEVYGVPGEQPTQENFFASIPKENFDVAKALARNDSQAASQPPEIIDDIKEIKEMFEKGEEAFKKHMPQA